MPGYQISQDRSHEEVYLSNPLSHAQSTDSAGVSGQLKWKEKAITGFPAHPFINT